MFSDKLLSRLGREAFYSLLSGVIYAFSQWLLLKLLFTYVGTATVGWYAYAMAIITPIMAFGSFGLRPLLSSDSRGEYAFSTYFSFRTATSLSTFALSIAVYYIMAPSQGLGAEMVGAFACLGLYRSVEWFSDLAQGEYQRQGRMKVVLGTYLFKLCFGVGGFAAMTIVFRSISLGFLAMTGVTISVLFGYELRSHRLLTVVKPDFDPQSMRKIAWFTLPVGVILLVGSLQGSIPRFLLERHVSLNALGIYAGVAYLGVFGGFFSAAISNAMIPVLSQHWAANRFEAFRKILVVVLAGDALLAFSIFVVFFCFGDSILRMIFNAEVAAYHTYLPLVAGIALMSFWDSHLGCALTVLRRFKTTMVIQVVRVIVVTPVAIVLVDRWDIAGALVVSIAFPLSSVAAFAAIVLRDYRKARHDLASGPKVLTLVADTTFRGAEAGKAPKPRNYGRHNMHIDEVR